MASRGNSGGTYPCGTLPRWSDFSLLAVVAARVDALLAVSDVTHGGDCAHGGDAPQERHHRDEAEREQRPDHFDHGDTQMSPSSWSDQPMVEPSAPYQKRSLV